MNIVLICIIYNELIVDKLQIASNDTKIIFISSAIEQNKIDFILLYCNPR
jgi:hypothetical protein